MAELKDSKEYYYDRFISMDFDNYYDVVISDILMNILNVKQMEMPSLLPEVVKEYVSAIIKLKGDLTTIIKDDYLEKLKFDETAFDKYLAKSKYSTGEAKDKIRDYIDNKLTKVSTDKINNAFAAVDKTKQTIKFLKTGKNLCEEMFELTNKIALINSFVESEYGFKDVLKALMNSIPTDGSLIKGSRMRSALSSYLNADNSRFDYWLEIAGAYGNSMFKMTLDGFSAVVGKSWSEYLGIKAFQALGKVKLAGGKVFSKAAAYKTL